MNAPALSSAQPADSPRQRAASIITAWLAWRQARRIKADTLVDAAVLGSVLVVWVLAYVAVCPPAPAAHHAQHAAVALR